MNGRRMRSLAIGLVFAGMALSVSGHAGWAPQKAQTVASMGSLELPALKKPITKRFVNAKLSEVLAWLSLEQFSFVADSSEFSQESTVTLNFRNQPLGAVLDAIADAFNGRWERRGEIFNLRPQATNALFGAGRTMPALPSGETRAEPMTAPSTVFTPLGRAQAPGTAATPQALAPLGGIARTSRAPTIAQRASGELFVPMVTKEAVRARSIAPLVTAPTAPMLQGARVSELLQGRNLAPTAPAQVAPLFRSGTLVPMVGTTVQDEKAHQEAMREVERALKAAEEQMKKLYESGEWKKAMEKAMAESRAMQGEEHQKAMAEARRAMEEAMKAVQNMPRSDEWKKTWAKAREEILKALKEGKVVENGKERKMTDKERQALEKSLKTMENIKMPEIKLDMKALEQMKALEKMDKTLVMPKLDMKGFTMPKVDSKAFVMPNLRNRVFMVPDDPNFKVRQEAVEKAIEEMNRRMKEMKDPEGRAFVMPKIDSRAFVVPKVKIDEMPELKALERTRPFILDSRRMRISELLNSLTDGQKEKQEKQGYLTLSDLTPKQREMLGSIPEEGNWTFSYSIDGKKVTIKNK